MISVDEVLQLAGVAAFTIAPALLQALVETHKPEAEVAELSLFKDKTKFAEQGIERASFVDAEGKYREAFARRDGGKGQAKTRQVYDRSCFIQS